MRYLRICSLIMICISLFILSGCNNKLQNSQLDTTTDIPSFKTQNEPEENDHHSVESNISMQLSSGAIVEANVEINPDIDLDSLTTYNAEIIKLDYDLIKQLLFSSKEIIDEGSSEMADARTDSLYHYCIASDGFSLGYTGAGFSFNNNENYPLMQRILNSDDVDLEQYIGLEDLNFATKQNAQQEIKSIIDQLGIEVASAPICYTLSFASLQSICDQINYNRQIAVGDDLFLYTPLTCVETDACYIFVYQITADGLPISTQPNGVFGDGSWTSGTSLTCFYSAQGIIGMEIPYTFKVTDQGSETKGLYPNQALERLDNKLNSMILSGNYQVHKIVFDYAPMPINGSRNKFQLIPSWRLSLSHTYQYQDMKDPDAIYSSVEEFDVIFNAITGEEIINNLGSA